MPPKYDQDKSSYLKHKPPDNDNQPPLIKPPRFIPHSPRKISNERLNVFKDGRRLQEKPKNSKEVKHSQSRAESDKKRDAEDAALRHPDNTSPPGKLSKNLSQQSMDISSLGREDFTSDTRESDQGPREKHKKNHTPEENESQMKKGATSSEDASNINSPNVPSHSRPVGKKKTGNADLSSVRFSGNQNNSAGGSKNQSKGTVITIIPVNKSNTHKDTITESDHKNKSNSKVKQIPVITDDTPLNKQPSKIPGSRVPIPIAAPRVTAATKTTENNASAMAAKNVEARDTAADGAAKDDARATAVDGAEKDDASATAVDGADKDDDSATAAKDDAGAMAVDEAAMDDAGATAVDEAAIDDASATTPNGAAKDDANATVPDEAATVPDEAVTEDDSTAAAQKVPDNDDDRFKIIIQFDEMDSIFLQDPIAINDAIYNAGIPHDDIKDIFVNNPRKMLILEANNKEVAEGWLQITEIAGSEVSCRWAKNAEHSSFGIIGPITCPRNKDEMERKKIRYTNLLKEKGTDVISVSWISKREKQDNTWITVFTKTLRIEFPGVIPEKVYLGSVIHCRNIYP